MRVTIFAALAVLTALGGGNAFAQQPGNAAAGERLAVAVCANCHLVREGQPQSPMDSVPSFAALANDPGMSDSRLRGFLNRPHFPMPSIDLSRQQIDDVMAYIHSRRGGAAAR